MNYATPTGSDRVLLHAALVREEGKTFGVLLLTSEAFDHEELRLQVIKDAPSLSVFAGHPVVVVAQNEHTGLGRCAGPRELVKLVARVSIEDLPWRTYSLDLV